MGLLCAKEQAVRIFRVDQLETVGRRTPYPPACVACLALCLSIEGSHSPFSGCCVNGGMLCLEVGGVIYLFTDGYSVALGE